MVTKMKIVTKTPEWLSMTEALTKINYKWREQDLLDYLVKNDYTTEEKIRKQIPVLNILNRIPNYRMTDWFYDLWDVSDVFIRHVNEDFRREEAEIFYYEQSIDLHQEESLGNDEYELQEPL